MLRIVGALALCLAVQAALADDPATDARTSTFDRSAEKVATGSEKNDDEFRPPPGFKTIKRGGLVVYCHTDATAGSRFKTQKCFDEQQLRALLTLDSRQRFPITDAR